MYRAMSAQTRLVRLDSRLIRDTRGHVSLSKQTRRYIMTVRQPRYNESDNNNIIIARNRICI